MGIEIYIPLYTQESYRPDPKITDAMMERIKDLRKRLESVPLITENYIRIEGGDDERDNL